MLERLTFTVPPQDYLTASAEGAFASVIQESRLQREKVRIYALARELNIDSKDLVDLCKQAGIDVKNQLSSLDPEQRDAVELLVRRGGAAVAVAAPPKAAGSSIPPLLAPVPNSAPPPPEARAGGGEAVGSFSSQAGTANPHPG